MEGNFNPGLRFPTDKSSSDYELTNKNHKTNKETSHYEQESAE